MSILRLLSTISAASASRLMSRTPPVSKFLPTERRVTAEGLGPAVQQSNNDPHVYQTENRIRLALGPGVDVLAAECP